MRIDCVRISLFLFKTFIVDVLVSINQDKNYTP